ADPAISLRAQAAPCLAVSRKAESHARSAHRRCPAGDGSGLEPGFTRARVRADPGRKRPAELIYKLERRISRRDPQHPPASFPLRCEAPGRGSEQGVQPCERRSEVSAQPTRAVTDGGANQKLGLSPLFI